MLKKDIFLYKISSNFFVESELTMDLFILEGLARNLKDLHFFIGKLNFEDPDPNGTANKVVAKIRKAF